MKSRTIAIFSAALFLLVVAVTIVVIKMNSPAAVKAAPDQSERSSSRFTPEQIARMDEILRQTSDLLNQGRFDNAQRILEKSIETYGRYRPFYEQLFQACVGLNQYEKAYSAIQEAINIGPASAEMYDAAGMAAFKSGYLEESAQHYALAMSKDPANPKYPLYRAQVLIKLHKNDEARRYLMQTINLDDSQEIAWGTLAQLALRDNEPDLALQYLKHAREINPGRTTWIIEQAKALQRKNKAQQAAVLLSSLPPGQLDQTGVMEQLSTCFAMLNRPAEAARFWKERSERHPRDWYSAWQAAEWFAKADDKENALRYAEIAIALDPDQEKPRDLLRKLTGKDHPGD
ncbi:MAG TPA: hypothetical protein ENJ06_01625 [Phycisphaeraceae bacterium]|nr:hypothetical protein [Phycisphaeraceae bacterium]